MATVEVIRAENVFERTATVDQMWEAFCGVIIGSRRHRFSPWHLLQTVRIDQVDLKPTFLQSLVSSRREIIAVAF